ncbi:MAG: N-acetyltransferase, partial [Rubrobacter sp.]|nr:N-acetyltransferase [Rubrobacter sp.]
HKLARGFLPAITYSAHGIHHPAFRRAIENYIAEERRMISYELAEYMEHDPYKS